MTLRSAYKRIVNIIGIAAISFLAAVATEFIGAKYNWDFRTPGMLVADLPSLSSLKFGETALVVISVDSMAYFLLILGLIALYKWRFGRNK